MPDPAVRVNFNPKTQPPKGVEEAGKVDRIRDILFGTQMRDYDGRFQRLDELLAHEAAEARGEVQRRIEGLENFLKAEVQSHEPSQRRAIRLRKRDRETGARPCRTARAIEGKIKGLDENTARELPTLPRGKARLCR